MSSQSEEDIDEARAEGHAAGVAEERARWTSAIESYGGTPEACDVLDRLARDIGGQE